MTEREDTIKLEKEHLKPVPFTDEEKKNMDDLRQMLDGMGFGN